jgi:hypothetical protein
MRILLSELGRMRKSRYNKKQIKKEVKAIFLLPEHWKVVNG